MKALSWVLGIALITGLMIAAPAGAAQKAAAGQAGTVSGKISDVDSGSNTVVVEVPKGKQMFTVAGPLAPKANVSRGGKPAKLSDFKKGDSVSVRYSRSDNGPVINSISSK